MNQPRIAFFGLGLMGTGMAGRLQEQGLPLTVYNRNPDKARDLAAKGARVAATPAEAAKDADVIISMVADDTASRQVWLGEDGALSTIAPGALCIECSTVTVDWTKEFATAVAGKACDALDAPVTGSRPQAASGELNFLVGGSAEALERARPVLSAMGRSVVHLGPTGSGALIKLVNNFVCGVQVAALAEAVTMIERGGLDREQALGVLTNGAPGSPLVKAVSTRMTTPDYTPFFHLHLMAKDLTYAVQEASKLGIDLKTATTALGMFLNAEAGGHGDQDIAAVIEPIRRE